MKFLSARFPQLKNSFALISRFTPPSLPVPHFLQINSLSRIFYIVSGDPAPVILQSSKFFSLSLSLKLIFFFFFFSLFLFCCKTENLLSTSGLLLNSFNFYSKIREKRSLRSSIQYYPTVVVLNHHRQIYFRLCNRERIPGFSSGQKIRCLRLSET